MCNYYRHQWYQIGKKVTRQFMDEHFLQEYIESVDQLYIQSKWTDIDPQSKSVSQQNHTFIMENNTCKKKYMKDDNERNLIKWIRITAIYGMKKRKLVSESTKWHVCCGKENNKTHTNIHP